MAPRIAALLVLAAALLAAGLEVRGDALRPPIGRDVRAEDLDALDIAIEPSDVEPAVGRDDALRIALAFHRGGELAGVSYGTLEFLDGGGIGEGLSWVFSMDPASLPFAGSCGPPPLDGRPKSCPRYETIAALVIVDAMTGDVMSKFTARPVGSRAP